MSAAMTPNRLLQLTAVVLIGLILALPAAAARAEGWHSAQPLPPPAPEGETSIGVPVALGHIGQISFWAPNRGLLITAGNETIPAGLYYYNGVFWRELSTVCGGAEGRIAWAGENDFWTISNQQTGQQSGAGGNSELEKANLSLCHFEPGPSGKLEVVASYAEPIGVPGSYHHMFAAACSEADNCWFGGETLPAGLNSGAFHLHWNGQTVTPLPSLETVEPRLEDPPYTVRSMVFYRGHFYESVQLEQGASSSQSPIHKIVEGSSNPFVPLIVEGPPAESLQAEGEREPFIYAGEGALQFSADSTQLWAAAGSTALLLSPKGQFQQIRLEDPTGALAGGIAGVAAEPGGEAAWASIGGESSSTAPARVARIGAGGTVGAQDQLPEAGEGLARKGAAGAIACPAQNDCWVATSQGWLFHLGGDYPEDDDPYFEGLIAYRPPDASIPFEAPETFPEDDSGDNPPSIPPPAALPAPAKAQPTAHEALFSDVKTKLVKRTTLMLTFTLATKSHVKLVALRKQRAVAATKALVLAGGRHTLRLRLRRKAWPTKLDLQVKAIGPVPLVPAEGAAGGPEAGQKGGPNTVATSSYRAPIAISLAAAPRVQLP